MPQDFCEFGLFEMDQVYFFAGKVGGKRFGNNGKEEMRV